MTPFILPSLTFNMKVKLLNGSQINMEWNCSGSKQSNIVRVTSLWLTWVQFKYLQTLKHWMKSFKFWLSDYLELQILTTYQGLKAFIFVFVRRLIRRFVYARFGRFFRIYRTTQPKWRCTQTSPIKSKIGLWSCHDSATHLIQIREIFFVWKVEKRVKRWYVNMKNRNLVGCFRHPTRQSHGAIFRNIRMEGNLEVLKI